MKSSSHGRSSAGIAGKTQWHLRLEKHLLIQRWMTVNTSDYLQLIPALRNHSFVSVSKNLFGREGQSRELEQDIHELKHI